MGLCSFSGARVEAPKDDEAGSRRVAGRAERPARQFVQERWCCAPRRSDSRPPCSPFESNKGKLHERSFVCKELGERTFVFCVWGPAKPPHQAFGEGAVRRSIATTKGATVPDRLVPSILRVQFSGRPRATWCRALTRLGRAKSTRFLRFRASLVWTLRRLANAQTATARPELFCPLWCNAPQTTPVSSVTMPLWRRQTEAALALIMQKNSTLSGCCAIPAAAVSWAEGGVAPLSIVGRSLASLRCGGASLEPGTGLHLCPATSRPAPRVGSPVDSTPYAAVRRPVGAHERELLR